MWLQLRSQLAPTILLCAATTLAVQAPLLAQAEPAAASQVPASELAEDPAVVEMIRYARTTDGAKEHIKVITSHFPHRITGSPHLDMAQDWIVASFEDWGIQAHKEQWGEVPVGFERDGGYGKIMEPEELDLTYLTPAWSAGTPGPVRGPAKLLPETLEEMRERAEEFKGAWVMRNASAPRRERNQRFELLEEIGVAGLLQPGTRDGRLVMGGSWRLDWEDLPTLVRITIAYEEYKELQIQVSEGLPVELEFDIRNQFLHGPIPQYNVVADIVGTEWPDEYVIVQGHVDAWDAAQGACDNGTGVATTLEAARLLLLHDIRPKRTIRFVFYGGEEQGLLGSKGYVELHADELEKISIVLNHDNGTNFLSGIHATAAMIDDFHGVFAPIKRLDSTREFEVVQVPSLRPGPSDHASFISAGVPAFHWLQSHEGYRRLHHTQYDTLDEVNHDDQRHSSLLVALAALRFANLDHLVDRAYMRQPDARKMGVYLGGDKGTTINGLVDGGRAKEAGWQAGDRILSVDGVDLKRRGQVAAEIRGGDARKAFVLEREGEKIESVLDWSEDPLEADRKAWRERAQAREEAAEKEDGK